MNYTIIGGDQKEYGPISADDIRQWITEGRLNSQTLCKGPTDTAWRTLGSFPEFADVFNAGTPPTISAIPSSSGAAGNAADPNWQAAVESRAPELRLGECLAAGFSFIGAN